MKTAMIGSAAYFVVGITLANGSGAMASAAFLATCLWTHICMHNLWP